MKNDKQYTVEDVRDYVRMKVYVFDYTFDSAIVDARKKFGEQLVNKFVIST